ncbi:MAG: hypothetical protein RRC34_02535 [Lentisphaeria bacterium]|nr:hypothetical protein [Lentisphaeria bacterium]
MMKRFIRLQLPATLFAILLGALLCSCASSDRAFRISPFSSGNTMSAERVNLWPLAYHDAEATSVLWPVIDIDDKGFAIRPLFNKDEHNYSILFPLCAWNPEHRDGWLGTCYWDGGEYGVFPLFHRGNLFKYAGPVWWSKNKDVVKSAGVFPAMAWNRNRGHWVLPLYRWQDWHDNGNKLTLGLGALAFVEKRPQESNFHMLPIGTFLNSYYTKDETNETKKLRKKDNYYLWGTTRFFTNTDATSWHIWPLAGVMRHQRNTFSDPLFKMNLVNSYRYDDEFSLFVTPLWGKTQTKKETITSALPLYYQKESGDRSSTNVLLLSGYRQSAEWKEWYLIPFINRLSGTDKPRSDSLTNYLAFFSSGNTPQHTYMRLGWGFLYSHEKEIEKDGTSKGNSFLTLYQQSSYQANDDGLNRMDQFSPYHWAQPHRLLQSTSFKLLPLVISEKSTYKQESRPLLARQLANNWQSRVLNARRNDSQGKLDALENRLKACLEKNQEATAILNRLKPGMTPQEKVDTVQEAMIAYAQNKTDVYTRSNFQIPLVFKTEKSLNTQKKSFFVLMNSRSYNQDEDTLFDRWALWNWQQMNQGPLQSKNMSVFPFWFHRKATNLRITNWDDELTEAVRDWRQSDIALTRNGWNIPASGIDKFSAEQKQLINVLEQYPEISEEVTRAKSADNVDAQAIILYETVKKLAKAKSETYPSSSTHIPLVFKFSHTGETNRWSFLLGMANGNRQGDQTKISVLRYLYRREKTPDSIYRDFFPFFTWNSTISSSNKTNEQSADNQLANSDFSFLWHVFHLRKENGKRSGHFLFFPFGK